MLSNECLKQTALKLLFQNHREPEIGQNAETLIGLISNNLNFVKHNDED